MEHSTKRRILTDSLVGFLESDQKVWTTCQPHDAPPAALENGPTSESERSAAASQLLSAEGDLIRSMDQDKGKASSSDEEAVDSEDQAKSAIYDYASEKSMSHEECKLFYQLDTHGRLGRARTFSLNYEGRASRRNYGSGVYNDQFQGRERSMAVPEPSLSTRWNTPNNTNAACSGEELLHQDRSGFVSALGGISATDGDGSAQMEETILADPGIHQELQEMSSMIQRVLDLRHKYIGLSLQRANDNPKTIRIGRSIRSHRSPCGPRTRRHLQARAQQ